MDRIKANLHRYGCLLLCLCLFLPFLPEKAAAAEQKTVRVGWYEDAAYNCTSENGERSGYGYEYQQAVSAYTGWNYEYVTGDWSELLEMLKNGEIDLMGGVSMTEDRTQDMLFSDLPMGEERYYLYADLADTDISASDLTTLNGKRIGMLKESIPTTQFCQWEQKHNLHTQHVEITSGDDALTKLANHELDGFISVESPRWEENGLSAFSSFGSSGIYFVINKDRSDLKNELDSAMRRIAHDRPFYTDTLYQRYLSAQSVETLNTGEQAWLKAHGAIRIGYLNNDEGVSVLDPKTGEMVGVISDYVCYAADCLGNQALKFDLYGFDTREEQLEALRNGQIDLIFHVSQNPSAAEESDFALSNTVWTFNMAALTTRTDFNENDANTIAVAKDNFALKNYISYNYPKWKVIEYDTQKAAEKAARNGEVDCFVTSASRVLRLVDSKKLCGVFLTQPGNTSFAVRHGDTVLLSILNKTLNALPDALLTGAMAMYDSAPDKVTLQSFLRDNLPVVTLGITLILLIMLALLVREQQASRQSKVLNTQLQESQSNLEQALRQAENANAAKTTFLNNMSHDIRTPINGIIGMLNVIQKCGNDPDCVQDCLHKIDLSSNLLLSLVNDVLDMAKLEKDSVILNDESVNLQEVCDEVISTVAFQAESAGLHVTDECDDMQGIFVWSSSLHLKKVLMNLFTNSIKYNRPGGSIHTSVKVLERTEERLTCRFQIEDTGVGMSQEFIENKLFTPFVQADHSPRSSYMGTGLGMSIVKQIVEKMGGTISVESKLGEGSRFTVVIPFRIDHEGKTEDREQFLDDDISGMCLLVAEDNELNMEIAEFLLTDNGAQVVQAKNGLEAVQKFASADAETYDAILMDVMMPVMDGLAATRKIRAMERPDAKTIPIIAMTANAFKEDGEKCLAAGMNAHLTKPLDLEKVKQTLCMQVKHNKE